MNATAKESPSPAHTPAPSSAPTTSYSRDHADVYEIVHAARGRDWKAEADLVVDAIKSVFPEANSVLDVACGTGAHMERFSTRFERVEGLELSAAMRAITDRRLPRLTVTPGDMRDFDLGRTFDAITCMCFSLGYMDSFEELSAVASSMARHLVPGGAVVVEPWWFPEKFLDGFVTGHITEDGDRVVSRVSHSVKGGAKSRMEVRFTIAEPSGIREFSESEVLSLFTRDEYENAFGQAGIDLEFDEGGPNGRGLFVGARRR